MYISKNIQSCYHICITLRWGIMRPTRDWQMELIMPAHTRTLSACLQPEVEGLPTSSPDSSSYYYSSCCSCCWWGDAKCQGAWAPATWPMLSTRTSKETLVHWSNRQVWIASWGCQFSTPIPMCVFTLAWIWSQRIYWHEVRTLSRLKQNSVSNVWNSWELPGQALSVRVYITRKCTRVDHWGSPSEVTCSMKRNTQVHPSWTNFLAKFHWLSNNTSGKRMPRVAV